MNKLSKFGLTAAVFTAALGVSTLAYATTIDFAALAVGNEGTHTGGTNGEVTWTATATGVADSVPYLDAPDGDGPAGLGVCSWPQTGPKQCNFRTDDNVGYALDVSSNPLETLNLAFDAEITITSLVFRNRDHGLLNTQEILIGIGSLTAYTTSASGVVNPIDLILAAGDVLSFTHALADDLAKTRARDFYLASLSYELGGNANNPVPVPAALPLFASGVAGLGYLARKRRKAVAKA